MKVRELMTSDASFCRANTNLAEAAVLMWQRDCGALPVVDEQNKAIAMITDRDICMAVATQNRRATQIRVGEIARRDNLATCRADDDAETALKTMKKRQVRRLPVVDNENNLLGVVSISDFLRRAGKGKDAVSRKKIFAALREISTFRPLQLHELNAENQIAAPNKTTIAGAKNDGDADSLSAQIFGADSADFSGAQSELAFANFGASASESKSSET